MPYEMAHRAYDRRTGQDGTKASIVAPVYERREYPPPSPRGYWATLTPAQQHEFAEDYLDAPPVTPEPPPVVFKIDPIQHEEPVPKPRLGHAALWDRKELLRVLDRYYGSLPKVAKAIGSDTRTVKDAITRLAPDVWEQRFRDSKCYETGRDTR